VLRVGWRLALVSHATQRLTWLAALAVPPPAAAASWVWVRASGRSSPASPALMVMTAALRSALMGALGVAPAVVFLAAPLADVAAPWRASRTHHDAAGVAEVHAAPAPHGQVLLLMMMPLPLLHPV
jgi:hypothetical protein